MFRNNLIKKRCLGAVILITGCCIGVGMIGLPIVSRLTGFMPATLAMFLSYVFTTFSGLLLLEATLWFDGRVNLSSIVRTTLGEKARAFTIGLFLFLFYSLFVAYLSAGGELFRQILAYIIPFKIPHTLGTIICLVFIVAVSFGGAIFIDGFNRVIVLGMAITYVTLIALGLENVDKSNLLYTNWKNIFGVFPILLICFGYQNLVPSVTYYLQRNVRAIRFAIIIGNFIPFIVYFIWNYVIIGMINSDLSLENDNVVIVSDLLMNLGKSSAKIEFVIKAFSLCAMLTSFLPSTLSFVDFVRDGFKKYFYKQSLKSELAIYSIIFIPSTFFALLYPQIFLQALSFAGGFVDVLLYGVLPALIIIFGRKQFINPKNYKVCGGLITPGLILVISIILLGLKIAYFK